MVFRIALVGDIFIDRKDPTTTLQKVKPIFDEADVVLANSEGVYSTHAPRPPSAGHQVVSEPRNAKGLQWAGIDAVSCANNHIVDGGHVGLLSTIQTLRELGLQTTGAGENITAARQPAIVDSGGKRVALLAYSCLYPIGYEARDNTPGLAPIRIDTSYHVPNPHYLMPGLSPRVTTQPWPADVASLRNDVSNAIDALGADIVVVSLHWGNSFRPIVLQDYEMQLGRIAIDAGADVVMGHHHHSLRGVEIYRGAPIFYGLGNFAFDLWNVEERWSEDERAHFRSEYGEYAFGPRQGFPAFPFHEDYRHTAIAVVEFDETGVQDCGLIPCIVRPDGPEPLAVAHPERSATAAYIDLVTRPLAMTKVYPDTGPILAGYEAMRVVRVDETA